MWWRRRSRQGNIEPVEVPDPTDAEPTSEAPDFTEQEVEEVRGFLQRLPSEDNLLFLPAHSIVRQFDTHRPIVRPLVNAPALAKIIRDRHSTTCWERAVAAWLLTRARILPEHISLATWALCDLLEAKLPEAPLALGWRSLRAVGPASLIAAGAATVSALLSATQVAAVSATLHRSLGITGNLSADGIRICALPLAAAGGAASILWLFRTAVTVPAAARADLSTRISAATALGAIRHPNSLVALTEAAYALSPSLREVASRSLRGILTRLRMEDYAELRSEVVPSLCRLLSHPDVTLVLNTLAALEKVGDARAIHPVRRMVDRGASPAIRMEAARILPALLERRRQLEDPFVLLRPAEPVSAPPAPPHAPAQEHTPLLPPAPPTSVAAPETVEEVRACADVYRLNCQASSRRRAKRRLVRASEQPDSRAAALRALRSWRRAVSHTAGLPRAHRLSAGQGWSRTV